MAQKTLMLSGSTYVCEETFRIMKINKACHRSKLSNQHLGSIGASVHVNKLGHNKTNVRL